MNKTATGILLLLCCTSLSAQFRFDAGVAAGRQAFESAGIGSKFVLGPDVLLSRNRVGFYYALEHADISSAGTLYGNHFGVSYSWPVARTLALRAGAGPSYVTAENVGGEFGWNTQVEFALRHGRLEWFGKLRHGEYSLAGFRTASVNPDGPALLAGVRFTFVE